MNIYIDIETIPTRDLVVIDEIISKMKPPANYKNEEVIQKWIDGNKESAILETSFNPTAGQICAICFAVDDGDVVKLKQDERIDEKQLINNFYSVLSEQLGRIRSGIWIAHNAEFDLRWLFVRSIINQSENQGIIIPVDDRYGSFCTMNAWRGFRGKTGGSLASICRALNIKVKDGMDGSQVWPEFQLGHFDKIAEYCADDVRACRSVYQQIMKYKKRV